MPFSRLLRTSSHPTLADSDLADAGGSTSDDSNLPWQASGSKATIRHRPLKAKGPSTTDHSSPSQSTSIPPSTESRVDTSPTPDPTIPSVHLNSVAVPSPERIPVIGAVQDKLAEALDTAKDGPKIADTSRAFHAVDDVFATTQTSAAPFEGIPILMNALDELTVLHPFIGVVVLAFKTAYTLELRRRDNDKKIISLFIEMKDMMGALLLLKGIEIDKFVAPDGINIEDHLKLLVERTADDIKKCSNVCDAYVKKRPLARVLLGSLWEAKLLEFVELFATRRQEFEFELTMRTSRGVDETNVKLDAINEQMSAMKALFEQLVSPEQKQLLDLVKAKGGVDVLRNDDKILLDLEKTASEGPSSLSVEGHCMRQTKSINTDPEVEDLRVDILEDPNVAAEKNWVMFSRKFETQLRTVLFPRNCLNRFASIASINTARNRETCGLLLGKYKGGRYVVTTLLIPKQHATGDTCVIDEEELVIQFTEERSLIILGWIHTHPMQSCFMSSMDLHRHSGFQRILPESFAVVCAPNSIPNFGIFRLTDPPGLQTIIECQMTEAFHLHPEQPIYTDAAKGHVQISDLPIEIDDLREHTASHRKPFALLSEDTLEFFKGSLSRYRHSEAGHIGEEEEVAHAARTAGGRDETISEPGTPKQHPATMPPSKTPAECNNVSPKSELPSVNDGDDLALPIDTSLQSEAAASPTSEISEGLDMLHRTPESQLHGQQLDYLRILQDKFGTPGPDRGDRYSCTDDASACNEGDGNYRKSFVDPDNESFNVRCSVKTVSKSSFSS